MFKGRHFDQSVILLCVRWYLAYGFKPSRLEGNDGRARYRFAFNPAPALKEQFEAIATSNPSGAGPHTLRRIFATELD